MSGHTELAFESAIEHGLLSGDRYEKRAADTFDPATALFPDDVIGFIRVSQSTRWDQLEAMLKDRTAATIIDSLTKELASKGALGVLRHGFKCYGKELRLAYFQPNSSMNPESARYAATRLTITRQVSFISNVLKKPDGTPRKCIIDVVLSVNGLPVVTAELKNPLTGQRAEDACKQYMNDRDGRDPLFRFKERALVHFAVDPDEAWMATELKGTPIIISTIQKFPFISQAIRTLEKKGEEVALSTAGKRFAVIVDEAHSSQSGETVAALKGILNKDGIADAIAAQLSDEEDEELSEEARAAIKKEMMSRARQPNLSFFAFTATPKFKTRAVFDELGPSGASPFHLYSMRQAIDEGFILDVLQNYTTYKRFFGLIKKIENDPEVPKKAAARALGQFLELHPVNIEQVVQVIIEHFRLKVMHELGGRAKAMVVTASRLSAVKYKQAFDNYIKGKGYTGIRALVAFSGTVQDPEQPGSAFTEVGMNNRLPERELPERFSGEEYRVLIVAEKYQTGFDQPLLQAMYVVKRLAGVQAVQTLSRLNRTAPGKTRTFVLDFRNEEDDIFKSFKPYYEATPVGENVDPQKLNELHHKLLQPAIFTPEDVTEFAAIWFKARRDPSGQDHRLMNAILDRCVARFKERAEMEQEDFRGLLIAFRNLHGFLSQILPYFDEELERLYAFVRNLISKLPQPSDGAKFTLDDDVALKFFRLQQVSDGTIDLSQGEADPLKGPTDVGTGQQSNTDIALSTLVDQLNERFGTDFTEADQLFFDQVRATAERDEKIVEAAKANNLANFSAFFGRVLDDLFIQRMDGNDEIFRRVMSDKQFRSVAQEHLAQEVFNRLQQSTSTEAAECDV